MNKYKFLAVIIVFAITLGASGVLAQVELGAKEKVLSPKFKITKTGGFAPQEVIVKFKPWMSKDSGEKLFEFSGIKHKKLATGVDFSVFELPSSRDVLSSIKFFSSLPFVEYAEPNYIVRLFFIPNDPYYSYQWNFKNINLEPAWDISQGKDVVVAVIDTGIAYENYSRYKLAPDLKETKFVAGYDFVEKDTHPNDDNGHGTHVAGTIAQTTNNKEGVAGVAFQAKLMPIKVLNKYGAGTVDGVAQGIRWAADRGAEVINLSLGSPEKSKTLEEAISYAYNKGVTLVAASGNDGKNIVYYPAAYDNYVIAVGATRYDNTKAGYSNYGSSLDLVAPGGDLSVDQNKDGYGDGILQQTLLQTWAGANPKKFNYYFYQGTSMAAPHVSGVGALLIASGISSPDSVREALESTALDLGEKGWDPEYGWGLVNAKAALEYNFSSQNQNIEEQSEEKSSPPEEVTEEPEPNQPPKALAGEDKNVFVGDEVLFDGSLSFDPDGEIIEYNWDFGDGSEAEGKVVKHIYTLEGNYTVTLSVEDNSGLSSKDWLEVQVTAPPVPESLKPLETEAKTLNFMGKEDSTFSWWESVYLKVNVSEENEPVEVASLAVEVYSDSGAKIKEFNDFTDNKGELFKNLGSFARRHDYKVLIEVEKEGYLATQTETSFRVR